MRITLYSHNLYTLRYENSRVSYIKDVELRTIGSAGYQTSSSAYSYLLVTIKSIQGFAVL